MNMRHLLCSLSVVSACMTLGAQEKSNPADVNNRTQERISATNRIGSSVYQYAAANALFRFSESFTELEAGMNLRNEEQAFLQAEGDGNREGMFRVHSHIRLNRHSAAFAGASYTNGKKNNVCWNSTSDNPLLYPYIQADSIGGDLRHEAYRFYGGYCRSDGRFHYGILADYRALHEYRQVDPRPRNITADLSATLSGGYTLGTYVAGLSAGIRIYKQAQDVAFYNENGANTSELLMTGLGTFHTRYSGTSTTDNRYRGTGFQSAVTLLPRQGNGWYATLAYDRFSTDRKLADFNMVTLTNLLTRQGIAEVAYRRKGKTFDWGIALKGNYERRLGTESILGSSNNNDNLPLGEQTMYTSHVVCTRVEGVMEWKRKNHSWTFQPAAGFFHRDEAYLFPEREMRYSLFHAGVSAAYTGICKDWLFKLSAGGSYEGNLSGTLNVTNGLTDQRILGMLNYDYGQFTRNRTRIHAEARIQKELSPTNAVFVSAGYQRRIDSGNYGADYLHVSAGLCF